MFWAYLKMASPSQISTNANLWLLGISRMMPPKRHETRTHLPTPPAILALDEPGQEGSILKDNHARVSKEIQDDLR